MASKDGTFRVVAIVGLIIGVAALTVGFAAFSTSLTISSSAKVTPANDPLNLVFSTSSSSAVTGTVTPSVSGANVTAGDATLASTTISGISATFTAPGQSATYSFNVYNASPYTAYLNTVTYGSASGASEFKVCTALTGTTQSYVDAACGNITVTVTTGSYSATGSVASGINHNLAATTGETATVVIAYTGTATADGDFTVAFGDITLGYSTVQSNGS